MSGPRSIGPTRSSGATCDSGQDPAPKSSTETTSRFRMTSRAREPGSAKRRPRATASGPMAATSSPSLATAFNTPAPFASHSLQAASQRIARIASVSVSAASWRASRRSGSLSPTMSSDRPMTTFPFATRHADVDFSTGEVSQLDAARPAVRRRCRQRVERAVRRGRTLARLPRRRSAELRDRSRTRPREHVW